MPGAEYVAVDCVCCVEDGGTTGAAPEVEYGSVGAGGAPYVVVINGGGALVVESARDEVGAKFGLSGIAEVE